MVTLVEGDLLLAEDDFIGHQCNCVTQNSAGLAAALFTKFPYANDYSTVRTPGRYRIYGDKDHRYVVNLLGQY